MGLSKILKLGDPQLYRVSKPLLQSELDAIESDIEVLHQALIEFRKKYGAGRAVAAPQIGVLKRFIYLNINEPIVLINPVISNYSQEMMEVWDDCLCFPNLLVKVKRSKSITLKFKDLEWNDQVWELEGDLSELIQHEYDHLDGILATQRAIDSKSFQFKS